MEKFEELKRIIASIDDDMYKFHFRLNGAAGTRIRKRMQDLKKVALEIRKDIQLLKKGRE